MSNNFESNQWFGSVPSDWKVERLQWHLDEIVEKNNPVKTTNILSLTNKLGVVPYSEKGNQGNVAKENYNEYKLAYENTIVANSMNVLIGSVGLSKYCGCVSPVYYVFKAKDGENINFYNYVFQTNEFQKELRRFANGILEIRLRVSSNDILKRLTPIPSFAEQLAIVSLLDKKISQINELIANQEAQIERVEEYKQAITDLAFVKCKTIKLKFLSNGITDGTHGSFLRVDNGKMLLSAKNLGEDELLLSSNESCISDDDYDSIIKCGFPRKNDILMCCVGEIGKVIIYNYDEIYAFQRSVMFIRPSNNILPEFLLYSLRTSYVKIQETKLTNKTIQSGLYQGLVKELLIPYADDNDKQKEIVTSLKSTLIIVDNLLKTKKKKIMALLNYKKSLVYEYVTGKKRCVCD